MSSPKAHAALERSGLLHAFGPQNVLPDDPHLGADLQTGLARGGHLLAELTGARAS